MSSDLKPCPNPWCDRPNSAYACQPLRSDGKWRARCTCVVRSPLAETREEAVAAWNRRSPDRAALVEVARRALAPRSGILLPEPREDAAQRAVAEYLAEQEGK